MIKVAGIDIGSTYSKAVLIDEDGDVVGRAVRRTGFKLAQASEAVFDELVADAGLTREQVSYVAATGYGRHTVPFRNKQLTELTAHAHA
ncbi:MAG TPA: BadF/BadG/BcrA/BcrD ATPase family protein, partial [Casimicrobiaceae bacterium]|nr:BadF/BadG/BcrA/BcrD ATPase family protein [Casimicrobiaceae bacterium]